MIKRILIAIGIGAAVVFCPIYPGKYVIMLLDRLTGRSGQGDYPKLDKMLEWMFGVLAVILLAIIVTLSKHLIHWIRTGE